MTAFQPVTANHVAETGSPTLKCSRHANGRVREDVTVEIYSSSPLGKSNSSVGDG